MKTIAHIHADLLDMEDGVKDKSSTIIDVCGNGMQCLQMICNIIRSVAKTGGMPEDMLLHWIKMLLPLDAKAEMSKIAIDADAIEKLKKER